MDAVNSLGSAAAATANGTYAVKKATDIQAESVTQLLNSVAAPAATQYNNPSNLGNKVDIKV